MGCINDIPREAYSYRLRSQNKNRLRKKCFYKNSSLFELQTIQYRNSHILLDLPHQEEQIVSRPNIKRTYKKEKKNNTLKEQNTLQCSKQESNLASTKQQFELEQTTYRPYNNKYKYPVDSDDLRKTQFITAQKQILNKKFQTQLPKISHLKVAGLSIISQQKESTIKNNSSIVKFSGIYEQQKQQLLKKQQFRKTGSIIRTQSLKQQ